MRCINGTFWPIWLSSSQKQMNVQLNTENRSLAMSVISHVGWYAWGRLLNIIIKSFDTIGFNFLKNYQYHRKKWIYSIFRKIVITIQGRWTSSNLNTLFVKRATKPSWRRKHESGSKQKGLNLRKESFNWNVVLQLSTRYILYKRFCIFR